MRRLLRLSTQDQNGLAACHMNPSLAHKATHHTFFATSMKNVSHLPSSLSLTSMLSTSNSPTPSSFLPLQMLGGLTFCCWIIHSSYFKNHRKEYFSVWSVKWEMRFWASLTVHHGRIEPKWRKTHTPGIFGGCSLETWIWRLWDGVLMILKSYGNHLPTYMQHHWDHSFQLWSWGPRCLRFKKVHLWDCLCSRKLVPSGS